MINWLLNKLRRNRISQPPGIQYIQIKSYDNQPLKVQSRSLSNGIWTMEDHDVGDTLTISGYNLTIYE